MAGADKKGITPVQYLSEMEAKVIIFKDLIFIIAWHTNNKINEFEELQAWKIWACTPQYWKISKITKGGTNKKKKLIKNYKQKETGKYNWSSNLICNNFLKFLL